jgi:hypothetical protein
MKRLFRCRDHDSRTFRLREKGCLIGKRARARITGAGYSNGWVTGVRLEGCGILFTKGLSDPAAVRIHANKTFPVKMEQSREIEDVIIHLQKMMKTRHCGSEKSSACMPGTRNTRYLAQARMKLDRVRFKGKDVPLIIFPGDASMTRNIQTSRKIVWKSHGPAALAFDEGEALRPRLGQWSARTSSILSNIHARNHFPLPPPRWFALCRPQDRAGSSAGASKALYL